MYFDALAYRRFRWHGVPPEVGDVERILTYTGNSLPVKHGDGDRSADAVLPFIAPLELLEPFVPVDVCPIGGRPEDSGKYPWERLITVAPARMILITLLSTMRELDDAQGKAALLAKMRRALKTTDKTAADVSQLVNGIYAGAMPIFEVASDFSTDDVVTVGDGETHAQSLNDLHIVALARACQALGVRVDAVIKKERVVTDEVGVTNDAVDIIRENEIAQRRKLAEWTGWELEVLI